VNGSEGAGVDMPLRRRGAERSETSDNRCRQVATNG